MYVLALLDFSPAFDTIGHPILVHRLHADLGFTDSVLQWFSSYLTDRAQYVSLSSNCFVFAPIHSDVHLGSVLGHMPFTMYTKPLSATTNSHSRIQNSFADVLQIQMPAPPLTKYRSYFTLSSHVLMTSKLWQLRTCINLVTTRQNSCSSHSKELSISITYLLQSLLTML